VRKIQVTALIAACLASAGCQHGSTPPVDDQRGPFNAWVVETLDDEAVSNAIITQRTLYPYHFVTNAAELNELGERDVKVLAGYFRKHPGQVNIRRGAEGEGVYDARVSAVRAALVLGGVDAATVKVSGGLPGGDGVPSRRAVEVGERMSQPMSTGSQSGASEVQVQSNGGER